MLEIVLPDHSRHALADDVTIGRGAGNTVRLTDASVSRVHARISAKGSGSAVLEDAGSSYGTWVVGGRVRAPTPVRKGSRIRVGNLELVVDRQRGDDDSLRTIVVPPSAVATVAARFGGRPRVRSGYALKRLEAAEGDRRWVLEDLRSGSFVRMSRSRRRPSRRAGSSGWRGRSTAASTGSQGAASDCGDLSPEAAARRGSPRPGGGLAGQGR